MERLQEPGYAFGRDSGFARVGFVWFGYGVTIGQQQGSWDPTSGVNNYWESFYKAIRSGYIFLESAKALPEQDLTEKDVEFMRNEVRFLISYYYVYMMQLYGSVPLVTSKFDSNASADELILSRTPMMEIAEWVDKELLELANYFPCELPNPSAQILRPVVIMAGKGLIRMQSLAKAITLIIRPSDSVWLNSI